MISKVEQAKIAQGWVQKSDPATCMNCRHFDSKIQATSLGFQAEKKLRCTLGGFKTCKMSTCNEFDRIGS